MTALVIKKLPPALHSRLKARALRNHRSLTKEAIAILEAGTGGPPPDPAVMGAVPDALFNELLAAGDELRKQGVDVKAWAARSRDVWR